MKICLSALAFAGALAAACSASADDGAGKWSVQAGGASAYMSKGIDKTGDDGQMWGRVEWSRSGFYAGTWASNFAAIGAHAELQGYVGWRPKVLGYDVDLAAVYKDFAGAPAGVDAHMVEFRSDVTRAFGPFNGRLHVDWTPDNAGAVKQALWVEARGGWKVRPATELSVGLGRREQQGGADYTAWNMGVRQKLGDHVSADLRWYDTDGHQFGDPYAGRLVAAVSASF